VAETDADTDVAEALNVKLKQAERTSNADRACSEAYASQIKVGIGWVEVTRELDPTRGRYRVKAPHRREMYWDWRGAEIDGSDWRYLVRRCWYDVDYLKQMFPCHGSLFERTANDWADWDQPQFHTSLDLAREYDSFLRSSIEELEWRDLDRKRLCLYEIWYRVWQRAVVMRLKNDTVIEYDARNPRHVQAAGLGLVHLQPALLAKMRRAFWVGPHPLIDTPSPFSHNRAPYVGFFGMREDRTGVPYGLIRRMMSPQDEVNTRLSKMMWLLSAKRVIADEDAVAMDVDELLEEVGRPDAYIPLSKTRTNRGSVDAAIKIESDFQLSAQQFEVLQDAAKAIQDTAGVYQALLGKESAAESGIAINSLVEQGSTTLAEINDNYRHGRREAGELLLSLVKEDMGENETVEVERAGRKIAVVVNQLTADPETGSKYRSNDIARTKSRVELEEVPATPSYRAQQLKQLTELTQALPPEIQALIIDMVVKATDLPQRHEIADRIRKATGIGAEEDLTEEERAERKDQAELARRGEVAEIAEREASVKEKEAKVEKTLAEVHKILADLKGLHGEELRADDDHQMARERHTREMRAPLPKAKERASA